MASPANPESDVIAAIDALERDDIDELVDWQMTDSPAARSMDCSICDAYAVIDRWGEPGTELVSQLVSALPPRGHAFHPVAPRRPLVAELGAILSTVEGLGTVSGPVADSGRGGNVT